MKKTTLIMLAVLFAFTAVLAGNAAAASDNPARDVANYTGNVVTGSVETVGEAAKGTTETAASPIVAFWEWLTGKGEGRNIVTDPVNKGGETVYDASVNTGKTLTGQKN